MNKIFNDLLSLMNRKTEILNDILVIMDKINPDISPDELNMLNSEMNSKFKELKIIDISFSKMENSFKNFIKEKKLGKILKIKYFEHEKLANLIQRKTAIKIEKLNREKNKLFSKIQKVNSNIKNIKTFNNNDSTNPQIFEKKL